MTKIAYNTCSGGFSLSNAGLEALLDLKGIVWRKEDNPYAPVFTVYYIKKDGEEVHVSRYYFSKDRTDPDLITVIEQLGQAADGFHARLAIRELSAGTKYRIEEYDGKENIMTPEDYTWSIA
jgi:hypothetical protein